MLEDPLLIPENWKLDERLEPQELDCWVDAEEEAEPNEEGPVEPAAALEDELWGIIEVRLSEDDKGRLDTMVEGKLVWVADVMIEEDVVTLVADELLAELEMAELLDWALDAVDTLWESDCTCIVLELNVDVITTEDGEFDVCELNGPLLDMLEATDEIQLDDPDLEANEDCQDNEDAAVWR